MLESILDGCAQHRSTLLTNFSFLGNQAIYGELRDALYTPHDPEYVKTLRDAKAAQRETLAEWATPKKLITAPGTGAPQVTVEA